MVKHNFKITNAEVKFINSKTGEAIRAIKNISDTTVDEVTENEYIGVCYDITFPNGEKYKGTGDIKKYDWEKLSRMFE